MNIPKQLKVGGVKYKVTIVDKINNGDAAGEMDNLELTIKLAKSNPQSMGLTFMHEIFHAINNELKETDVEFFAQALYQVIQDNPILFKEGGAPKHGQQKRHSSTKS